MAVSCMLPAARRAAQRRRFSDSMNASSILTTAIRTAAFLFGCFIILAGIPVVLMGGPGDADALTPMPRHVVVSLMVALVASGFLFIAFRGGRVASSVKHRVIAIILLLPALGAGANLLFVTPVHEELRTMGWVLFVPACVLLSWSAWRFRLASGGDG